MKPVVASALASAGGFIAGHVTPSLIFIAAHYANRSPSDDRHGTGLDEYFLLFYFTGVYALAGCVAYVAITATSRHWRSRAPREAAAISAGAGVAAQLLYWTSLSMFALMPLSRVLPHGVAAYVGVAMPGIIAGVAVLLWSVLRAPR